MTKHFSYMIFIFQFCFSSLLYSEVVSEIESLIGQEVVNKKFMGQISVVSKGSLIFNKSYGAINLELGVLHKNQSAFLIGSLTKQFTASAIMLLEERGLLNVKDTIGTYLSDYPEPAKSTVTLHHLLTHTSGIPNYTVIPSLIKNGSVKMELHQIIESFYKLPLEFVPGAQFKYSNSGYVLLGKIIEKVSKQTYNDFLQMHLFRKTDLKKTSLSDPNELVLSRAQGYTRNNQGSDFLNAPFIHSANGHAAGGMISTADDLLQWDRSLRSGKVLSTLTLDKMFTPHVLFPLFPNSHYGYGWIIDKICQKDREWHFGVYSGFGSYFARLKNEETVVLVLNNVESDKTVNLGERIMRKILPCKMTDKN